MILPTESVAQNTSHQPTLRCEIDTSGNLWINHEKITFTSVTLDYWIQLTGEIPEKFEEKKRLLPGHFRSAYYVFNSAGIVLDYMVRSDSSELFTHIWWNINSSAYYPTEKLFTDTIIVCGVPVHTNTDFTRLQNDAWFSAHSMQKKNGKQYSGFIGVLFNPESVVLKRDRHTNTIAEIGYRQSQSWNYTAGVASGE